MGCLSPPKKSTGYMPNFINDFDGLFDMSPPGVSPNRVIKTRSERTERKRQLMRMVGKAVRLGPCPHTAAAQSWAQDEVR